jgi:hypothetical protein
LHEVVATAKTSFFYKMQSEKGDETYKGHCLGQGMVEERRKRTVFQKGRNGVGPGLDETKLVRR